MVDVVYDAMGNTSGQTIDPTTTSSIPDVKNIFSGVVTGLKELGTDAMIELTRKQISTMQPEAAIDHLTKQISTMTGDPAMKKSAVELGEVLKSDPDLAKALHGALVKDPTMLKGMVEMAKEEGGAFFQPAELKAVIADPTKKNALVSTLNKVAENENVTFRDFKYILDNRNNPVKVLGKMREIGVSPTDVVSGDQIFSMLREALMSPTGFRDLMTQLPQMLGLTGAQAAAATDALQTLGNFMDMCMGTKTDGFRALAVKYGDSAYDSTKKFGEDILGMTDEATRTKLKEQGVSDEEIERRLAEAGNGTVVDPKSAALAGKLTEGSRVLTAHYDEAKAKVLYEVPPDQAAEFKAADESVKGWTQQKTRPQESFDATMN